MKAASLRLVVIIACAVWIALGIAMPIARGAAPTPATTPSSPGVVGPPTPESPGSSGEVEPSELSSRAAVVLEVHGAIGPALPAFAHLWEYARRLYARPEFRGTTRLSAFAAPFANLPDWQG